MVRGALVGLIYSKTLQSRSYFHDRGKAITLMNSDVDSLCGTGRMVHDVWAYLLESTIGMVILASQVGWLSPIPLVIIVCKDTALLKTLNSIPVFLAPLITYTC